MQSDSPHFHRGKAARAEGKPREILDARLSVSSRQEWLDGWDYQDAFMRPPPTDAQKADHAAFCGRLLDLLK